MTAAAAWTRARDYVLEDKPQLALEVIEALPTDITGNLRWCLLRLQQHFLLKHDGVVAADSVAVRIAIDAERSINEHERKYLHAYLSWLLDVGYRELADKGGDRIAALSLGSIDLGRVRPLWKLPFALTIHPDWKK